MLSNDSILRKIPTVIEPKTAMFIDGIRHAVEIIDLAYSRLCATLTSTALSPPSSEELPRTSAAAFLDAWAIVDAIDRFRMLYQKMTGMTFGSPTPGVPTLKEVTQPIRDLRNVADHLAQRAEFVVSKGDGAALGSLSWITLFQINPITIWHCTLRPGTIRKQPEFRTEPLVATLDLPSSNICLSSGGYEANLSEILPHIEKRIKHLETQIEAAFSKLGISDAPAASDVFLRKAYSPKTGPE